MAVNWAERISAFSRSPSRFLSGTTAEAFLAELLRELRDDRASYSVKVSMYGEMYNKLIPGPFKCVQMPAPLLIHPVRNTVPGLTFGETLTLPN